MTHFLQFLNHATIEYPILPSYLKQEEAVEHRLPVVYFLQSDKLDNARDLREDGDSNICYILQLDSVLQAGQCDFWKTRVFMFYPTTLGGRK